MAILNIIKFKILEIKKRKFWRRKLELNTAMMLKYKN